MGCCLPRVLVLPQLPRPPVPELVRDPVPEPSVAPQRVPEPIRAPAPAPVPVPVPPMVWVTKTGKCWHSRARCGNSKTAIMMTRADAEEHEPSGRKPRATTCASGQNAPPPPASKYLSRRYPFQEDLASIALPSPAKRRPLPACRRRAAARGEAAVHAARRAASARS